MLCAIAAYSIFEKEKSNAYLVRRPLWICLYKTEGVFKPQEILEDIKYSVGQSQILSQADIYVLNGTDVDFNDNYVNKPEACVKELEKQYMIYIYNNLERVCLITCYDNGSPKIIRYEITLAAQTQNSFFVVYEHLLLDRTESQRYLLSAEVKIQTSAIFYDKVSLTIAIKDVYNSYIVTKESHILTYYSIPEGYTAEDALSCLQTSSCEDSTFLKNLGITYYQVKNISTLSHLHHAEIRIPKKNMYAQLCFETEKGLNADYQTTNYTEEGETKQKAGQEEDDTEHKEPSPEKKSVLCLETTKIKFTNYCELSYSLIFVFLLILIVYYLCYENRFKLIEKASNKYESLILKFFFKLVESDIFKAKKRMNNEYWQDDMNDDISLNSDDLLNTLEDNEAGESSKRYNSDNREYDIFVQISWLFAYPKKEEQVYQPENVNSSEIFKLKQYIKTIEPENTTVPEKTTQLNMIFNLKTNVAEEEIIQEDDDELDNFMKLNNNNKPKDFNFKEKSSSTDDDEFSEDLNNVLHFSVSNSDTSSDFENE